MIKQFAITLLPILALIFFGGCNDPEQVQFGQKKLEELEQLIEKLPSDEIKNKLEAIINNPDQSIEELKKLRQIEYKVFSIAVSTPQKELEALLNIHGKERWDCNKLADNSGSISFICKRPVDSPLRLIPHSVIGR
jgi:hypothetical protein